MRSRLVPALSLLALWACATKPAAQPAVEAPSAEGSAEADGAYADQTTAQLAAFNQGQSMAGGATMQELAAAASALDAEVVGQFWGGVARDWGGDLSDPAGLAAAIRAEVPALWQSALRDGVIRYATVTNRGDPRAVHAFTDPFAAALGDDETLAGIRSGFEALYAEDIEAGIAQGSAWLEPDAGGLFEVLGWAAATPAGKTRGAVLKLLAEVPEAYRCDFAHGGVRRLASRRPFETAEDWSQIRERVLALGEDCQESNFRAVGLALLERSQATPGEDDVRDRLALISDEGERSLAAAAIAQALADDPPPVWSLAAPPSGPPG